MVLAALPVHGSVTIVPGLVDLTHVQNTGAAFGLLNTAEFPFKTTILAVVAALALMGIAMYSARLAPHQKIARAALALVLGGAVGNLIDRLRYGYVVDFVDVYWREHHFWAFNVADAAISVGVVLMMLDMLFQGRNVPETL
ncbi:MAG: signal peptidase II [Acidobacteria bacterium]|nr:signal peptidase II [Acidobacteriota bacterium]